MSTFSFISRSGFLRNKSRILLQLLGFRHSLQAIKNGQYWGRLVRKVPFVATPALLASRALFGLGNKSTNMAGDSYDLKELCSNVDEWFSDNDDQKIYDALKPRAGDKEDEILWRLARSTYRLAQKAEPKQQQPMYKEAFDFADQALKLNDKNFACHKWYAILLDIVGGYEGTKKRIENAYIVKEHFQTAHELNPEDATSLHTLGYWHFLFADLPWYQRKIAGVIFADPPSATYDEALTYFVQAEEKDPGFYNMNLLMIGKTHHRKGNKTEAEKYFRQVLEKNAKTVDDQKALDEAKKFLGVK